MRLSKNLASCLYCSRSCSKSPSSFVSTSYEERNRAETHRRIVLQHILKVSLVGADPVRTSQTSAEALLFPDVSVQRRDLTGLFSYASIGMPKVAMYQAD